MVDFRKLMENQNLSKKINPLEIYDSLDKRSGKEYIRPSQKYILNEWYSNYKDKRDLIIKLPTGQGKTLIGLLILQSFLNDGKGPAIYLCPNNFLVGQTLEQAALFGIKAVGSGRSSELPLEFRNSEAIYITSCSKLFNGKSKFGLKGISTDIVSVGCIVMDDAHKCLDYIKDSFSIKIQRSDELYSKIHELFSDSLAHQEHGTSIAISDGDKSNFLAVPYWNWHQNQDQIMKLFYDNKNSESLNLPWNLLKNNLENCYCLISGDHIEIHPRIIPVDMIPSFFQSKKRIFLSATLSEDAFLIKNLQIDPESVVNPLIYQEMSFTGDRVILMPMRLDATLDDAKIRHFLVKKLNRQKHYGLVALTPTFKYAKTNWMQFNSEIPYVDDIKDKLEDLAKKIRSKAVTKPLILVNEYDGVDLPDDLCRILVLDSLPYYVPLIDKFLQFCRPESTFINKEKVQRIEQGLGRAIRGPNDFCFVIVLGNDLVYYLSEKNKLSLLSEEARRQIEIGIELSEDIKKSSDPLNALSDLIDQCIEISLRDTSGWKDYYKNQMESVRASSNSSSYVETFVKELNAELALKTQNFKKAIEIIDEIVNKLDPSEKSDIGWYLQLKAIYTSYYNFPLSQEIQLKAYSENNYLFKPEIGVTYSKFLKFNYQAVNILNGVKNHENFNQMILHVHNILNNLAFNIESKDFEGSIDNLGKVLFGFNTQRPDKTIGIGPDNLWQLKEDYYWLIECKNMVNRDKSISKRETGQLSNAIDWFKSQYGNGPNLKMILFRKNYQFEQNAVIAEEIYVITPEILNGIKERVKGFYLSFLNEDFSNLTTYIIQEKIKTFKIDSQSIESFLIKIN